MPRYEYNKAGAKVRSVSGARAARFKVITPLIERSDERISRAAKIRADLERQDLSPKRRKRLLAELEQLFRY
jgi:hypothetical protein